MHRETEVLEAEAQVARLPYACSTSPKMDTGLGKIALMHTARFMNSLAKGLQEETEWQEQGAREAAWKLAKNVLKLKEHQRAIFFSPSENRCLLASTLKPEEREFVVDSGASMHMISKKDVNSADWKP